MSSRSETRALLETLRREPTNAAAYASLGVILVGSERVKLPDGRTMGERELFLEALRHNPARSAAYSGLGAIISFGGERVKLPDGRTMDAAELKAEAARLKSGGGVYRAPASLPSPPRRQVEVAAAPPRRLAPRLRRLLLR